MRMLTRGAALTVGLIAGTAVGIGPVTAAESVHDQGRGIASTVNDPCPGGPSCEPVRQPIPYIIYGVHKYPCERLSSHTVDRTEVQLTVRNRGQRAITLYWHNMSGFRESSRVIPAGGSVNYTTYRGHAWEVASDNGTCLNQFVILDDATRALLNYS